MKKILLLILLIPLLFFAYKATVQDTSDLKVYHDKQLTVGDRNYKLYVADTEEKRVKGLSGVRSLNRDEGMLFVFDEVGVHEFWMKDMHFPLDFIFLRDNNVVNLLENVSPGSYPDIYKPESPSDAVIEFNAGEIKRSGVMVGTTIRVRSN